MLLQTHWLYGSASRRTWQKTSCIKHARLVLSSTRVWLCMSPALRLCMVMVCMFCGAQCSLCHVCAPITCRASQRDNSMLPSGTWCYGSWRCTWHTPIVARAWQHLVCRHLRPSLPVLLSQP
jgi:hypothetical protein